MARHWIAAIVIVATGTSVVAATDGNATTPSIDATARCLYPCYCSESCGSWMWPLCDLDCPKCEPCTNNSTALSNTTGQHAIDGPNETGVQSQAHRHDHHKHGDAKHEERKHAHAK